MLSILAGESAQHFLAPYFLFLCHLSVHKLRRRLKMLVGTRTNGRRAARMARPESPSHFPHIQPSISWQHLQL